MSRMRHGLTAIAVLLLILSLLAGCAETNPTGAADGQPDTAVAEPMRLKVGDQPLATGGSSAGSPGQPESGDRAGELQRQLELFLSTWGLVDQEFYNQDAIDYQKMARGAIRGMLESLGDEGTAFSDTSTARVADEDMRGSFEGIGVTVEMRAKRLTIVSPFDDSPGAKAGLRGGDVIVRINERDAAGLSLVDAVSLIRGPAGTTVRLTIEREAAQQPLTFDIPRAKINVVPVKAQMMDGNIVYVKINQFSEPVAGMLQERLAAILSNKPKAVILDLRNNPGGLLASAVEVASQFIGEGVVLNERRHGMPEQAINTRPGGLATRLPVIVLVNRGTASAAEVVAGALQDHRRAILVGERTFGKDTVQNVYPLGDGSTVSITVARWSTPGKREIGGRGIDPDIQVPLSEQDVKAGRDPQLDRALERARSGGQSAQNPSHSQTAEARAH